MCLSLLAALAFGARGANAAQELWLTWWDCPLDLAASHDQTFQCDSDIPILPLFVSFRPPSDTGADVIGIECVVDVQHALPAIPDWWRLSVSSECRSGQLTASSDFSSGGACADPWSGAGAAEVQGYVYGEPRNSTSQLRIKAVAAVPSSTPATLSQSSLYYGLRLLLGTLHTSISPTCEGCLAPACLVLNSILIRRLPGSPGGDLLIVSPGGVEGNRATWRGGAGADCALVPARRTSWGGIKSLYR